MEKRLKQGNKFEEILSKMTFALISGFVASVIFAFGPWDLIGEVCSNKYIPSDINGLKVDLEKNVFGQHIAKEYLLSVLEHHVTFPPDKALALYFYGPTGTGKNLVTSYIAKNMFKEGTKSRYYHYFNGFKDFGHAEKKDEYREKIKAYVQKAAGYCETNIFVFDEVHEIVPGVLDALLPYIDATRTMFGLDYRKNIFIFLSNSGGDDLMSLTSKYLEDGKKREDITINDTLPLIKGGTLFQKDGLKDSILKNLITQHIPFLPLEKEHVKKCIKAELKLKKWLATDDVLNRIANEMMYVPPEKELFSKIGCRKIKVKMDLYVNDFLSKV